MVYPRHPLRSLRSAAAMSLFVIASTLVCLAADQSGLTWSKLKTTSSPSARGGAAVAYDPTIKKVVLFGGFTTNSHLNDTSTFDGSTWSKVKNKTAPSPRAATMMAYDRNIHKIVLFGGYTGRAELNDTWLWDGSTSTWTKAKPKTVPTAVTGPMLF